MADRVEMSFRNKEVKMWFLIMIPVVIMGIVAIFSSDHIARFVPIFLLFGGLATYSYYIWRFRYRRKKRANAKK